jgi:hypothetical protein
VKKWGLHTRRPRLTKDEELVEAVRELWSNHVSPNEMLRILTEEKGYTIGPRQLSTLRKQHKFFVRSDGGTIKTGDAQDDIAAQSRSLSPSAQLIAPNNPQTPAPIHLTPRPTLTPQQEQALSEKRTRIRERRLRRAKSFPDTLKFPSEMRLADSKAHLSLDDASYQAVRTTFANICTEMGIERKKGCAHWETGKDRLIASVPALQTTFFDNMGNEVTGKVKSDKIQAIDVICMDTIKNLRNLQSRMVVREAKKLIGLTPAQVTNARVALESKLEAEGFTTKTESGERWKAIREEWIVEQGLGEKGDDVRRACGVICDDVMKRYSAKTREKFGRRWTSQSPNPGGNAAGGDPESGNEKFEDAMEPEDTTMHEDSMHEEDVTMNAPPTNGHTRNEYPAPPTPAMAARNGYEAPSQGYRFYSVEPYPTSANHDQYRLPALNNSNYPPNTTPAKLQSITFNLEDGSSITRPASEYPNLDPRILNDVRTPVPAPSPAPYNTRARGNRKT